MFSKNKKILIVAAHPDDEILGCGGTVARLIKQGCSAYTLILGEGITSRDEQRDIKKRSRDLLELKEQAVQANRAIGIKEVYFCGFPDNRFDSKPILDIIRAIEKIKIKIKPDIIYTHFAKNLNIDHQITYKAVITATRPLTNETVKEIYSFEILSSTEWNYPISFSPDLFIDITSGLKDKIRALRCYKSELRTSSHPRSTHGVILNAEYWGTRVGIKYAEAFKTVRVIK